MLSSGLIDHRKKRRVVGLKKKDLNITVKIAPRLPEPLPCLVPLTGPGIRKFSVLSGELSSAQINVTRLSTFKPLVPSYTSHLSAYRTIDPDLCSVFDCFVGALRFHHGRIRRLREAACR